VCFLTGPLSPEGPWIAFEASVDYVATIIRSQPQGHQRTNASGTHNNNTIIVNAGGDIVIIHGWGGILETLLRVYSDIETFTSIGWGVYGHPGWMEEVETQRSRDARGAFDSGNRRTQSKGAEGEGDGR